MSREMCLLCNTRLLQVSETSDAQNQAGDSLCSRDRKHTQRSAAVHYIPATVSESAVLAVTIQHILTSDMTSQEKVGEEEIKALIH